MSSSQFRSDLTALPAYVEPSFQFHPENDPHVGDRIPQFALKAAERTTKPILVVIGGSCSECSLHSFDPSVIDTRPFSKVRLVYQTTPDLLPERLKSISKPFDVITDVSGALTAQLNGAWYPRFYEFSPDGRLLDYQRLKGDAVTFMRLRKS